MTASENTFRNQFWKKMTDLVLEYDLHTFNPNIKEMERELMDAYDAAMQAFTAAVETVIGEDEPAGRPVPDYLIGQTDAQINNELRAEQRQRLAEMVGTGSLPPPSTPTAQGHEAELTLSNSTPLSQPSEEDAIDQTVFETYGHKTQAGEWIMPAMYFKKAEKLRQSLRGLIAEARNTALNDAKTAIDKVGIPDPYGRQAWYAVDKLIPQHYSAALGGKSDK